MDANSLGQLVNDSLLWLLAKLQESSAGSLSPIPHHPQLRKRRRNPSGEVSFRLCNLFGQTSRLGEGCGPHSLQTFFLSNWQNGSSNGIKAEHF